MKRKVFIRVTMKNVNVLNWCYNTSNQFDSIIRKTTKQWRPAKWKDQKHFHTLLHLQKFSTESWSWSIRMFANETFTLNVQFSVMQFPRINLDFLRTMEQSKLVSCCCGSAAEWINQKLNRKVFIFIVNRFSNFKFVSSWVFCIAAEDVSGRVEEYFKGIC